MLYHIMPGIYKYSGPLNVVKWNEEAFYIAPYSRIALLLREYS